MKKSHFCPYVKKFPSGREPACSRLQPWPASRWRKLRRESTCGKCKVKVCKDCRRARHIRKKALSEAELAEGWVLACQREVVDDTVVELQLSSDAHDRKAPSPVLRLILNRSRALKKSP